MTDVTEILSQIESGDPSAAAQLLPLVYDELRKLAAAKLALERALERLEGESPRRAELVKLRYFAGLTLDEAARVLSISRATADRDWAYAKVFLYCEMKDFETI